jgi:HAD superfamily hydrolase (TIGR01509 family)
MTDLPETQYSAAAKIVAQLHAVIFDMDGVLIDSVAIAQRVRSQALEKYGVALSDLPDPQGEEHKGSSLKDLATAAEEQLGQSIPFEELRHTVAEGMRNDLMTTTDGADSQLVRLLTELQSAGIKLGIATAGIRQGAYNKLEILGIRSYFSTIITADDVTKHKPHPDLYLLAMEQLGVSARNCIVFEDSLAGVAAGNAAGATVVGFTGYNTNKSALLNAALTIDNWNEITVQSLQKLLH